MLASKTRIPFRILSFLVGMFLLGVGLPFTLLDQQLDWLGRIFFVGCVVVGGVGLVLGSFTGRWFNSPA